MDAALIRESLDRLRLSATKFRPNHIQFTEDVGKLPFLGVLLKDRQDLAEVGAE
jgi:hypothetical protein